MAWQPAGLTDGVRLLGQPTPRLVALLAAGGVALAVYALFRATKIPPAIRYTLAALGLYGAAAFVIGALSDLPLTALLSGHSLWQRFPTILQGAFIGGLIVLPLGVAASAVNAGLRRSGAEASQIVALVTSLALVLAGVPFSGRSHAVGDVAREASSLPASLPESASAAPGSTASTYAPSPFESLAATTRGGSDLSPAERIAALSHSFRAMEDGDREAARHRWDVSYVASRLGNDPSRTFAWVRNSAFWVPYHGLLRGPVGVLMDRLGNGLDRALLLASLFKEHRLSVRLAHAQLSQDQAIRLLPALVLSRFGRRVAPAQIQPAGDPWAAVATKYEFDEAALRTAVNEQADSGARLTSELQTRAANQARRLADAVAPAPRDVNGLELMQAIGALKDRWWVQTSENGVWRDWDLIGLAGSASMTPDRTADPGDVPADLSTRSSCEWWQSSGLLAPCVSASRSNRLSGLRI